MKYTYMYDDSWLETNNFEILKAIINPYQNSKIYIEEPNIKILLKNVDEIPELKKKRFKDSVSYYQIINDDKFEYDYFLLDFKKRKPTHFLNVECICYKNLNLKHFKIRNGECIPPNWVSEYKTTNKDHYSPIQDFRFHIDYN